MDSGKVRGFEVGGFCKGRGSTRTGSHQLKVFFCNLCLKFVTFWDNKIGFTHPAMRARVKYCACHVQAISRKFDDQLTKVTSLNRIRYWWLAWTTSVVVPCGRRMRGIGICPPPPLTENSHRICTNLRSSPKRKWMSSNPPKSNPPVVSPLLKNFTPDTMADPVYTKS